MRPWWRGAILYQVYVRSFFDFDGDGQGDLPGVLAKLDYIAGLGVDGIWLSPIQPSPNRDWGYDVADYDGVQPDYGTLEDFARLLEAAHERGLKVVLDQVLAHTSDEHPWFVESLTGGPQGPKADWYVWAEPKVDGTAPNNWLSVFGGPAWAYQPRRRQHYHHKFLRQQPKLNWRAPAAQEAALSVLDRWLEKGADGFRLDVANAYLHDPALTDNPPVPEAGRGDWNWTDAGRLQKHLHDSNLEENRALMGVVRRRVEAHPGERYVFGEFSEEEERAGAFLAPDEGLHSGYTFVLLTETRLTPAVFREHYATLARHPRHWPTICLSNHDVKRTVTRFGGEHPPPDLAKLMFALLLSLKGSTIIYQGEELGLPEAGLARSQLRDPVGDLFWPYDGGRDGARTPMPWDAGLPNLGFSEGEPWLPAAAEHRALSVADQEADPESNLAFARQMVALRKASPALTQGEIEFLDTPDPVLAFVRRWDDEAVACVFNLSPEPRFIELPQAEGGALHPLRAGDADLRGGSLGIAPWSAAFVALRP
jgi:alpha-glucosidase